MAKSSDLIQGTLDLLILKTLAREPIHGWGIAKRIEKLSDDVLSVGQGSLYPALHRLEQQGWISAEWRDSDLGRSAKFYSLTREGRKQLAIELNSWTRLSSAVALVIGRRPPVGEDDIFHGGFVVLEDVEHPARATAVDLGLIGARRSGTDQGDIFHRPKI